jgi:hypothetical protein
MLEEFFKGRKRVFFIEMINHLLTEVLADPSSRFDGIWMNSVRAKQS